MAGRMAGPQRPKDMLPSSGPQSQTCAKCGAVFRWQPSDPKVVGSPLVAQLTKPVDGCDCGYGTGAPILED